MPRKFLDTILNRPSQSYTAAPDPSTTAWSHSAAPTDLPNAPAGPSSLRPPPSTVATTTKPPKTSRFGRSKHKSRPSIDGNSTFNDGASSIADTTVSFSSKKKRWWDTSSLRGFGKGTRSRAGSVAGGESIFSEPQQWAPPAGLAGIGAASVGAGPPRTLRGARSDVGATTRSPSMRMPPLPAHDAAALRAMNATARQEASVAPLGQQPPSLNQHAASLNKRHSSKTDLRTASLTPSTSAGPRRALSVSGYSANAPLSSAASATSSDWNDFMKTMSNRGVSKAWTRHPAPDTTVQRRRSVLDRVQKELQEDAQFEQVQRDPGVVRGDLLARAASAVVGEGEQAPQQDLPASVLPSGLRPGSIIGAPEPAVTSPRRSMEAAQQYREPQPAPAPQAQAQPPPTAIPVYPTAAPAAPAAPAIVAATPDSSFEQENSEEVESQASSSEEEDSHRLDAVAEEDEENSSVGHNEMRYGPRASYLPKTPPVKHSQLPPSPPTVPVPTLPVLVTKEEPASFEADPQSPRVPPKDTHLLRPSLDISTAVKPTLVKGDVVHSAAPSSGDGDGSAYASAEDEADVSSNDESDSSSEIAAHQAREEETDEESGKDGEVVERPASRAVTFDALQNEGLVRKVSQGSQKAASTASAGATVDDTATETGSTSTRRRRGGAPSLQRRLSDLSLGNSFAFSHFMGSRMTGRSSSRRIKMGDSDSDSDNGSHASEDDEELKKLALAEQERLRRMSVGDDFFGGSLSDVLAQFDKMDFGQGTTSQEKTAMLAEKAQQGGVSKEDTSEAQAQAQQIVNEVRRRRAGGATGADAKTVHSEAAGTLAASFAALLLMADNDPEPEVPATAAAPATTSTMNTPKPAPPADLPSSPSTYNARLFAPVSATAPTPTSPPERKQSIMDRPRQRAAKPFEMGGIAISRGKLAAEAPKAAPQDERSTLPSLATFRKDKDKGHSRTLSASSETPSSPKTATSKRSIDLGDQQRSKDKPPPVKSALKPKTLRPSKSLADTLFSFGSSPKKVAAKAEKASKKEQKKRARAMSLSSDKEVKATGLPAPAPVSAPAPVPVAPQAQQQPPSSSSSNASPVKEAGEPVYPLAATVLQNPSPPRADKGKGREIVEEDRPEQVAAPTLLPLPRHPSEETTSPSTEISERSAVSTALTSPSQAHAPITPEEKPQQQQQPAISLPPPPTFDDVSRVHADDETPQAIPRSEPSFSTAVPTEPAFGMNIIPPTPPAVSSPNVNAPAEQMRRSHSTASSMRTPTAEVPQPILGDGLDLTRPELARSSSSKSAVPSRKSSRRKSMQPSESGEMSSALNLPAGMTVTTVASSSSQPKRRKSVKKSEVPATKRRSEVQPLPLAGVPVMGGLPASPSAPRPPAKDSIPSPVSAVPSRVYAKPAGGHGSEGSGFANTSLASLSPPPSTATSSVGTPDERDASPARSLGSRSSSTNISSSHGGGSGAGYGYAGVGASGASNYAASATSEDGLSSSGMSGHRARVRTQSQGPSRRGSTMAMTAIDEWASSSPISRATSPYYDGELAGVNGTPYDIVASVSPSVTSGNGNANESPAFVRNAPMGAPIEALLHPPVPRSRLSLVTDDLRPTASLDGHSDNGHGPGGLSRANSLRSVSHSPSVDGHGLSHQQSVRRSPMSLTSGMSGYSATPSMSSLPSVPKSGYRPQDPIKAAGSSTVDDRLYQRSTMQTISVLSGAFKGQAGGASKSLSKRRSMDVGAASANGAELPSAARSSMDRVPEHLQDELGLTTMALTAHTPPPRKIGSGHVLVQVIAVAIDEMDRMLLRDKVRSDSAYGYVPGRSFCGRVMEVGWEVKRLRKGDVVFGLQSARKCGALAEFMTVQQDLVAKAPEDCLTVEQISALPSAGVLAHQVMRNHCSNLPKGARILILNAHDGVGLLSMQECADAGPVIVAQCPASVADGVAVCEANGAHEVVVGEALWAMNTLHESSFDLVLDTVGGRRLYDAARRILATNGQFVTCFGDEQGSANPNFKSHMRSLRRTFFKKDKKNIGYEWIGVDSSDDCREALEAVRAVAEAGDICPRLRSILAFGDAPRAFDPVLKGGEDDQPGAVVVRVS